MLFSQAVLLADTFIDLTLILTFVIGKPNRFEKVSNTTATIASGLVCRFGSIRPRPPPPGRAFSSDGSEKFARKNANPSAKSLLPSESMLKVKWVVKSAKSPVPLSHRCNGSTYIALPTLPFNATLRSFGVTWMPWFVTYASPATLMRRFWNWYGTQAPGSQQLGFHRNRKLKMRLHLNWLSRLAWASLVEGSQNVCRTEEDVEEPVDTEDEVKCVLLLELQDITGLNIPVQNALFPFFVQIGQSRGQALCNSIPELPIQG
nr:hypothetical protein C4D60_Mb08t03100 [Ipomoea batatas]